MIAAPLLQCPLNERARRMLEHMAKLDQAGAVPSTNIRTLLTTDGLGDRIIVLRLPHFMHHEGWDPKYTNTHVAAGAIVIIAAIISGLMTTIEMKKTAR